MEFNRDLLTKPKFPSYFDEHLRAYARHGVWDKKPAAYYEGAGAWFDMTKSDDPAVMSRYKALADIVAKRQHKADSGFIFKPETK
jgi:hypothetical protein